MNNINWPTVITTILGSGVMAALCTALVNWKLAKKQKEYERYEKLYGPLKFNLMMMKLMVENKADILEDINKWGSVDMRNDLLMKHYSPLTIKWIEYRDIIRNLIEKNPGLIKEADIGLISDFMDGCIKKEIIEEGKNALATNPNRMNKLTEVVAKLQKKLL